MLIPAEFLAVIVFAKVFVVVPLENVKTAPSPEVPMPVIVWSTVIMLDPTETTLVPAGTVEFPPVTVTTSLT